MADTLEIFGVEYTGVTALVATDDNGNDLVYVRGGGHVIQDQDGFIVLPATGEGGGGSSGGSKQEKTGIVTGGGTNTLQISCDFEPQEIYIRGNLTSDVSLRGIISFIMIKDKQLTITNDSSTSNSQENAWIVKSINGFNEENLSSEPYVSYSNGVLTIDTVVNSSGARWTSGITYSYDLIAYSGSSEGGDEYTRTVIVPQQTVTAGSNRQATLTNYSDTLEPTKHYIVTLDGVEWYTTCKNLWTNNYTIGEAAWFIASNPSINDLVYPFGAIYDGTEFAVALSDQNQHTVKIERLVLTEKTIVEIPLNTELIDYTKAVSNYVINENGEPEAQEWSSYSDYTPISPSMTFTYTANYWFYLAFYTASKEFIRSMNITNDSIVDPNDGNIGHGTLSGSKIPSMAAYVRITGGYNASSSNLSLIRTA